MELTRKSDMYYGVQYYPEHWPEKRWAVDVEMMLRAGINVVRMGEFAWSCFEPREGALSFETYDRAVRLFHENGIRVIFCTCSRTPPPWVLTKYPEIPNTDFSGRTFPPGHRYRIGLLHPDFVQEAERIDRAVVEHFAGNPAIEAWQIDNEVGSGNDCYCDGCLEKFRRYLQAKYTTLDDLNRSLGAHFWSDAYNDWSEVPKPSTQPQLLLEYRRFISHVTCEFTRWRADLIRDLDPDTWITTNFQSIFTQHTDYHALGQHLDVNGLNHYPPRSPELILDASRQGRKPLIILEQFTRLLDADSGEGWMRLYAWMAIAHGCCGINFFRWRCCRWGQEQFADGILPHSGKENRLYRELVRMGGELKHLGRRIDTTLPEAEVALAYGYDSRWATECIQRRTRKVDCIEEAMRVHASLSRQNWMTDVLDPRGDLSPYKLLIAPQLMLVDDQTASNLRIWVEAGGTLCLTAHSGVVDEYGKSFDTPRPGPLAEMAGIEVSDMALLDKHWPLASEVIPALHGNVGTTLADEIQVTTAEVLATFDAGWRKGLPVLTRNAWGQGEVFYLGTVLEEEAMDALTAHLCTAAGVLPVMNTPKGVKAYERKGPQERLLFLLNFTEDPQTVPLPEAGKDIVTGGRVTSVDIAPVDLRIISL